MKLLLNNDSNLVYGNELRSLIDQLIFNFY